MTTHDAAAGVLLAFGALEAALCGHNIQHQRLALAAFQMFGALFCLLVATAQLVTS